VPPSPNVTPVRVKSKGAAFPDRVIARRQFFRLCLCPGVGGLGVAAGAL
jgi:hypothetical protein